MQYKLLALLATTLALTACKPHNTSGYTSAGTAQPTPSATVSSVTTSLTALNNPNFTVYYSKERNTPAFVVEALTASNVSQRVTRLDEFSTDTRIQQYTTKAYSRSGYDRGHMAAAANQTNESMAASNLLSNIVPQNPESNRKSWRELEESTRDEVAKQSGVTYVITGVIGELSGFGYRKGDPYLITDNTSKDKLYPSGLLNEKIAIPAYLYKIRVHNGQVQDIHVSPNCAPVGTKENTSYCYASNMMSTYGNDLNRFYNDFKAWDDSYAPALPTVMKLINSLPR